MFDFLQNFEQSALQYDPIILLVPGIGAQGGSLGEVARYGLNNKCGLLVNSSRGIIFADNSRNFDRVAVQKAQEIPAQGVLPSKKVLYPLHR